MKNHPIIIVAALAGITAIASVPALAQGKGGIMSKGGGGGHAHSASHGSDHAMRGNGGGAPGFPVGLQVQGAGVDTNGLPPGLAKQDPLPPGLAKRSTLPPGLAKNHPTPPGLAKRNQLPPGLR